LENFLSGGGEWRRGAEKNIFWRKFNLASLAQFCVENRSFG
jgi:hypothetical protein